MRENCTCSLSGGRRPARSSDCAPPPTRVRVAGKWTYLYRALDSEGNTIDFMLSPYRDRIAAKHFLQLALWRVGHLRPRVINVDGHPAYPSVIAEIKQTPELSNVCRCRPSPYLNNVIEMVQSQMTNSAGCAERS